MRKTDGRRRSREGQEAVRRLGVAMLAEGETQAGVARRLSVRPNTVSEWSKREAMGGDEALVSKPTPGRPRKLTALQRQRLFRLVTGKNPQQLNFPFALWTTALVAQLIFREFGVSLHRDNVRKLLRDFGLSPQVPLARSYKHSEAACERWISEEFPAVVQEIRRKQAVLLFLDECGVHESDLSGRTWAPVGERPVIRTTGGRARVNVISAVSPTGRLWFRCYRGTLTTELFITFLRAMLRDIRGKIVLVWDRLRVHTAKAVADFLAVGPGARISAHLLPSYAPELNPDEHVWSHLKRHLGKIPHEPGQVLHDRVAEAMDELAAQRPKIKTVFRAPTTKYVLEALSC